MKKHLLLLFTALLPLVASAQTTVEIDGIWYNLVSKAKQAEVTFKGDYYYSYWDEYSGSITIPATVTYDGVAYSVTSIGDDAFRYCSSLTDVYCYAVTVPSTKADAFYDSNTVQATLHVPASALDSYRATAPWSSFGTIVALTDEVTGIELPTDNRQQTTDNGHLRPPRPPRSTPTKGGIYIVDGKKVMVKTGM